MKWILIISLCFAVAWLLSWGATTAIEFVSRDSLSEEVTRRRLRRAVIVSGIGVGCVLVGLVWALFQAAEVTLAVGGVSLGLLNVTLPILAGALKAKGRHLSLPERARAIERELEQRVLLRDVLRATRESSDDREAVPPNGNHQRIHSAQRAGLLLLAIVGVVGMGRASDIAIIHDESASLEESGRQRAVEFVSAHASELADGHDRVVVALASDRGAWTERVWISVPQPPAFHHCDEREPEPPRGKQRLLWQLPAVRNHFRKKVRAECTRTEEEALIRYNREQELFRARVRDTLTVTAPKEHVRTRMVEAVEAVKRSGAEAVVLIGDGIENPARRIPGNLADGLDTALFILVPQRTTTRATRDGRALAEEWQSAGFRVLFVTELNERSFREEAP